MLGVCVLMTNFFKNESRQSFCRLACVLPIVCLAQAIGSSLTTAAELPTSLRESLLSYAASFRQIRLEWTLQRESSLDVPSLMAGLGTKRDNFLDPETGILIISDEKYYRQESRMQSAEETSGNPKKVYYTASFDGELYFDIESGDMPSRSVSRHESMRLKDIGERPFEFLGIRHRSGLAPESEILAHIDNGGRLIAIETSSLVLVKLKPRKWSYSVWSDREYHFYLDPNKSHAVARIDWVRPDGRLIQTTVNDDWTQLKSSGVWVPRRSTQTWHTYWFNPNEHLGSPLFNELVTLTNVSHELGLHPPFHPNLDEPGVHISDFRSEAADKPGARWNEAMEKWDYTNPPASLAPVTGSPWRAILVWLNIGLVLVVAILYFLRQGRRHESK